MHRSLLQHLRQLFFELQAAILALQIKRDRIFGFLQLHFILFQIFRHDRPFDQVRSAKIIFFEDGLSFFRRHKADEEL